MASAARTRPSSSLPLLNPEVIAQADQWAAQFASAQPFRHVVIDSFLDPESCQALISEFPAFSKERALNEHGETGGKAVVGELSSIGPAYASFDRLLKSASFLALMSRITGIPDLLYDPEYEGGGTHENRNGQELDTHVDFNYHPRTRWHRRLNLILFLNPQWREEWGGCLELLRDPFDPQPAHMVTPLANRCVIFETNEVSWHGFRKIALPEGMDLSRRSIAVYFYTKKEPTAGAVPSHGTFYYQRPLPEHLRAGYTLSPEDMREVETLLARRDQHIRFLYHRELEFANVIESLMAVTRSKTFRLAHALSLPLVKARDLFKGKRNADGA